MTHEEFQKTVTKKTLFDRYFYKSLCIITIAGSLLLLFGLIFYPESFSGNFLFHFTCFLFLLALGIFGLYKLGNRYKIVTITSSKSMEEKKEALRQVLKSLDVSPLFFADNFAKFQYSKSFWSSRYDVYLFYDEQLICYSVQGQDSNGGFIDFGGSEKFRRRLEDEIEFSLTLVTATSVSV